MIKHTIKLTIIFMFLTSGYLSSDEIFKWVDEAGVENYSNDPTQVPYGDWLSSTSKKTSEEKTGSETGKDIISSDDTVSFPEGTKKQLSKFLEAEKKLKEIITAKNEELNNLKKQKETSKDELLKLENFILQAEDRLKVVQKEKDEFLKQNNLNSNI